MSKSATEDRLVEAAPAADDESNLTEKQKLDKLQQEREALAKANKDLKMELKEMKKKMDYQIILSFIFFIKIFFYKKKVPPSKTKIF